MRRVIKRAFYTLSRERGTCERTGLNYSSSVLAPDYYLSRGANPRQKPGLKIEIKLLRKVSSRNARGVPSERDSVPY